MHDAGAALCASPAGKLTISRFASAKHFPSRLNILGVPRYTFLQHIPIQCCIIDACVHHLKTLIMDRSPVTSKLQPDYGAANVHCRAAASPQFSKVSLQYL